MMRLLPALLAALAATAACDSDTPTETDGDGTDLPGGVIHFVAQGELSDGIRSIRPDGTGETRITPDTLHVRHFDVSHSGGELVMAVEQRRSVAPRIDLVVLDPTAGTLENVTRTVERFGSDGEAPFYTDPSWAPDGSAFVAVRSTGSSSELWVVSRDGTERRLEGAGDVAHAGPRWSPDGTRIAFRATSVPGRSWQCHVLLVDGATGPPIGDFFQCDAFAWSPDGGTLVFSARVEEHWDLHAADRDGGAVDLLVPSIDHRLGPTLPAWSPEGARVAFVAYDPASGENVFVMNPDGSEIELVPAGSGSQRDVSFSPDGTHVVLASITTSSTSLDLARLDSGEPARRLTSAPEIVQPRWVELP